MNGFSVGKQGPSRWEGQAGSDGSEARLDAEGIRPDLEMNQGEDISINMF